MGQLAATFGARVKALRVHRKMSQAQLAEAAHVSDEWVRRIERGDGKPSLDTVEAIAGALGCAPEGLFASAGQDDVAAESLILAIRRLSPEEMLWLEEAIGLLARRPLP